MVHRSWFSRMRNSSSSSGSVFKLQSIISYGLRQEYPPIWPLPLPSQLIQHSGRPTLVLDIDETLLHTYGMRAVSTSEIFNSNINSNSNSNKESLLLLSEEDKLSHVKDMVAFALFLRPHLKEFLTEVKELYEIVFWTAGTASYCSAMLDAMETQVLQLPPSFYNVNEIRRDAFKTNNNNNNNNNNNKFTTTEHVNFYALSRTQTLEEHNYMKYLPMLGRPMHRVIMIDDNVRSFPLNPRNGIKISPFLPNSKILQEYSHAISIIQRNSEEVILKEEDKLYFKNETQLQEAIIAGKNEITKLESDRALLDLLPMLRAAAKAEDLTKELDYWRDDEYIRCDEFRETMNPLSVTRQRILGNVLTTRRETPIPALKSHVINHGFIEEANTAMRVQQMQKVRARL